MRYASEACGSEVPALFVVMGGLALIALIVCAATVAYALIDLRRNT